MTPGYVYVLVNDAMPGLVKIGRTSRDVDVRASELWQTGVPTKFDVYTKVRTCNCSQLEAYVHSDLRKHRVHKCREFFKVDPEVAAEKTKFWAAFQAQDMVGELFDEILVERWHAAVSGFEVERLAKDAQQPIRVIADAIETMTAEELAPAIKRVRDRMRKEHFDILKRIGIPESEWSEPNL